jgi:hypothetical protein
MQINKSLIIHPLKIAIATTISAYLGLLIDAGHMFYIMITVVFVLQTEIASSIKKSAERVFGTILGAPIGVGVVLLVGVQHEMPLLLISGISLIIVILMMKDNYAVAITFLTLALVVVYGLTEGSVFTETTKSRVLDTVYGTIIALLVSLAIFPSSLSRALKKDWADFLRSSALFFESNIQKCANQDNIDEISSIRKGYIDRCNTIVKKVQESAWELGLFGSSRINSHLRVRLLRVPTLLKDRAMEMSVISLKSIDMDEVARGSILELSVAVKTKFYECADGFESGKNIDVQVDELYTMLDKTIESLGGVIFKNKNSSGEELNKLMEISTFYEQVVGVIDTLKDISSRAP